MNQQCKVCGEPAAGFHFGAFTCEGCKSFFGRTYNNVHSIQECKNGNKCVINKKNRTSCKACRLRKCLLVGMSKSGSRYGRRSNWFKIHCLLQEQNNGNQVVPPLPNGNPFNPGFIQGFMPQSGPQPGTSYGDGNDRVSPHHEDLALRSHLLHVAFMQQERDRTNKSPHPDDVALHNQLRLMAWERERDRVGGGLPQQCSGSPLREHQQQQFSLNFAQRDGACAAASSSDVFRPFLQAYKRAVDTPSDSGRSSSMEGVDGQDTESRSNSAMSSFKASAASPTFSEREFPPRKINATVTFTTGYHAPQDLGPYSLPGLITPATSQYSPRGGDLHLVSPSPGGLAVEQDEPIDLSIKSNKSSPRPSHISEEDNRSNGNECDHDEEEEETPPPLDLTLNLKRRKVLPMSL